MSELLIITEPGRSTGFKLAGFEALELGEGDDPSKFIIELESELEARSERYSLLCIDTETLGRVEPMVIKKIKKKGLPIIIPLDIPQVWQGEKEIESPIVRMLRRAIGYQIKIKK